MKVNLFDLPSESDIRAALDGKFFRLGTEGRTRMIPVPRDYLPEHHRLYESQQEMSRGASAVMRRRGGRRS